MHIVIISFLTALGELIMLCRLMGVQRCIRYQAVLDLTFTIGVPLLFLGTFSGVLLAVLSGIWFTLLLWFISLFVTIPPRKQHEK